MGGSKMG